MTAPDDVTADWCASDGQLTICGTRMREHSRRLLGARWCFTCRVRHEFHLVVMAPDGPSWYGPHVEVQGVNDWCTDLFPGWTRGDDDD